MQAVNIHRFKRASSCRSLILLLAFASANLTFPSVRAVEKVGLFSDWRSSSVDYSKKPHQLRLDCKSLAAWSEYPAQVLIAEHGSRHDDLPEYCDVLGHIQSNIKFRLFLPVNWNGRFFMVGNGGFAGDDLLEPEYPQHLKKMQVGR